MNFQHFSPRVESAIKHVLDASAGSAALASFLGFLQPVLACIASLFSIVWLGIQIADWLERKRAKAGMKA